MLGAAVATAAGTAVAIVGIPGTNHNGTPAAWAVTKNADGTVTLKLATTAIQKACSGNCVKPACVPTS